MAYFSRKQDSMERACKVAADLACAALLAVFSVVFFAGWVALPRSFIGVDYLVPDPDGADVAGVVR